MTLQDNLERCVSVPSENEDTSPTLATSGELVDELIYARDDCYRGYSGRQRSLGVILTLVFHALAFSVFLIHWGVSYVQEEELILSVFDVAPPASPPEPETEIPPGPAQVEKEKPLPVPDRPKIDPPEIRIQNDNLIALPEPPAPDPSPPVEQTTAPESKPAPPASRLSGAKPTWQGQVLAALNRKKRYPRKAQRSRQQGEPWIRFIMDRDGKVLSVSLERSSGFRVLDDEAVKLPKRAQPLPKPPEEVLGDMIELVVPVEFFIR